MVGALTGEASMTIPNDIPPFGPRNVIRSPEFWLLFFAAMAAGFGLSGWISIPATIAGLLILSLPKYLPLYPRAKTVGGVAEFRAAVLASVLNATMVAVAVFLLGRASWWLWGL